MKDVFYTLLVVWIVWRILNSVNSVRTKQAERPSTPPRKEGETTVDFTPPKKRSVGDSEGEYVDYEEIK